MNVFARKRLPSKHSKNRRFFHKFLKNVKRYGGFCWFSGNLPSCSQDFSPKAHSLWEIGRYSIAGEITYTSGSPSPPARHSGFVAPKSAWLCFRLRQKRRPLPWVSSPHAARFTGPARGPHFLLVLPALHHRQFVTAVVIFILRVDFPSGKPDGSPVSFHPLRAE